MKQNNHNKLVPKNPWHLVWIVLVATALLTAIVNCVQSLVWYGSISYDLLLIGTIDVFFVVLIVTPIAIKLGLIEQQRIKDELKALAFTDELTKLHNRRGFYLLAEQLLKISLRTKVGLYLMYVDLDDFKKINDNFGHSEGDQALKAFARLLKENYRESDIIARIGGDEFVLLPVGTSSEHISTIRNRFENTLNKFNKENEHPWNLSASIGIALYDPEAPCSLEELIKIADKALYGHKQSNKM